MTKLWKILVFIGFTIVFFSVPWYILRIESDSIKLSNEEYKTQKYESAKSLNFLRTSYANSLTIFDENFSFMEYLSEVFEIEVRLLVSKNYDEFGEFLKNKTADIVWGNSEHYLKNRELYKDYVIVLRPVVKGQDKYRGIIITNKNSNVNSVMELKNKIFAFTDIKSGSGYKLPMELFENKYNIEIYNFFADVEYLQTHEEVVKNVFYGKVDGGAVFESAPESFLEKEQAKNIKILDYTRYIYNEPVLIKKEIYEKYKHIIDSEKFYEFPENVRKDLKIDGIVRANEKEYLVNN
ncbi:MAG: phosphate/phosphite/phosphonate ABC transporter substrate-binding protein [Candidatus Muirbacterium halophilum]|nr:phosphate/phosphite/phosphonate ABC transporter substrate-binding protein [Candidatus Muirbacterium halophilum]MCK9476434.1 phosphate/phosphite/phosphonate ABC transporter substrate-binding protein [Candidatus Muirbacterium halophilum]